MINSYYSESNEDNENNKDIFMNIGIQLNKQFINSDSDSDSDSDSESEIKREKLYNIGMYMYELSFSNEINYNEIMNKVLQELLVLTVKNNYISDNYFSDTDDEFFNLSDDEADEIFSFVNNTKQN
jgi:hypothetical protein